jgi:RND family efflux transporter MFP subunit
MYMANSIRNTTNRFKKLPRGEAFRGFYRRTTGFIKRRPLSSFFIVLGLLLLVIIVGNILSAPKPQKPTPPAAKAVQTYNIGETPKATFQARIDKAGVIKIVALAGGVVQRINVSEGDPVYQGTQLFSLSSNYQGGNAPAIQAQIAAAQYQNVANTFGQQKDAIQKQRDIANINHDNYFDQQKIASASAGDTASLIDFNQNILDALNAAYTSDPTNATVAGEISQLQGGQNQLRAALRNLQTQTDSGKPAGRLADTQRDLTLEQLDLQEKTLELNKEVTQLQANLAEVSAATMYPASPFAGTVQRIYVRVGQLVSPGTVLAEISGTDASTQAIVTVPATVAQQISKIEPTIIHIGNQTYSVRPTYISTEATDGALYTITYPIPDDAKAITTDGDYVNVDIPVGMANTSAAVPFVPLDAIYQTQDKNYLLVVKNGKAETREVTLGNVFGSYAQIETGLNPGDQVILDRSIVAGDKVTTN